MRTQEELEALCAKFDDDMATKSRFMRWALTVDQRLNVLWLNGSQDETVSSHIGRKQKAGTSTWLQDKLCCMLSNLEYNHCNKSLGE
jgi:hypothetical protein